MYKKVSVTKIKILKWMYNVTSKDKKNISIHVRSKYMINENKPFKMA